MNIDSLENSISGLLNPESTFYIYFYPFIISIFSGFIFWLIFSYFPEKRRNKSFEIGIFNDLLILNGHLFSYFDLLLRHSKHSPSYCQHQIHACSLSLKDFSVALQSKVISKDYLYYQEVADKMIIIGEELVRSVEEIDLVINRLYSFNYFLDAKYVILIRNIHGNIHRYMPFIETNFKPTHLPINPSVSYLSHSAYALQENFKELRSLIFKDKLKDRNYVIHKVLRLFYSGEFKKCIKECQFGRNVFPEDVLLCNLFLINCYMKLDKKKIAYKLLNEYELSSKDLISQRNNLYPLLTDDVAAKIILDKTNLESLNEMKAVVEREALRREDFIVESNNLSNYFSKQS